MTPVMALPVLLLLIVAVVVVVLVLRYGSEGRRTKRALAAVTAARPGWTSFAVPSGPGLAQRYRHRYPFDGPNPVFRDLMYGPVPGGAQAEVFHFGTTYWHAGAPVAAGWTVAVVVHPRPLPAVMVQPGDNALPPGWPPGPGRTYDAAGSGPLWAGLRGYALDPQAADALFTPDVLGRTRALGLDWRLEGRTAIALAPGHRPPRAMLELVDQLARFAAQLPEEALRAAAGQPDPWSGPSVEQPA